MANTTNYNWETPDDTDLVKDGAAAIRTLGSSVDTTTKALNPSTTLGDIEYRSSTANTNTRLAIGSTGQVLTVSGGVPAWATSDDANAIQNAIVDAKGDLISATAADTPARLAVGANGTVLTADSAEATGLKWAAAAGGGGANWTLLNSGGTALTAAQTITVSGISGKDKIMVLIDNASSASANGYVQYRFNTDTGSNYYFYGSNITWPASYNPANGDGSAGAATGITAFGLSTGASSYGSGYLIMTGANSSGVKSFNQVGGSYPAGGTNGNTHYFTGGYYNSASTISSVSIFSGVGNFDAGTVYVYTSA